MSAKVSVKLRLWRSDEVAIGPGKADLLDAIHQTGSISAAARAMDMSYRRAWTLVEVMNRSFREPLVHSIIGGNRGGGATLTVTGIRVLTHYRQMEDAALAVARKDMALLLAEMNV